MITFLLSARPKTTNLPKNIKQNARLSAHQINKTRSNVLFLKGNTLIFGQNHDHHEVRLNLQ